VSSSRKGIALLIALLFIITLTGLAAIFMQLSREAFESAHAQKTRLSTLAMLSDIKSEVIGPLVERAIEGARVSCELTSEPAACQREVKAAIFGSIYNLPLSFVHEGERTLLTCEPAGSRLDINRLRLEQNASNEAANAAAHHRRTRFERFLQEEYRLYATWQFLELLDFVFDTTGEVNAYLANDERLFVAGDRFYRGAVLDERHFYQIVRDYVLLSHDEQALEVPWGDFLSFDVPTKQIDFDHIAPEACALIYGSDAPPLCEASVPYGTIGELKAYSQESNLSTHHFDLQLGYNPIMSCRVRWQSGEVIHTYRFAYDIDNQRLYNFSILP
jgi:hypothetical protein